MQYKVAEDVFWELSKEGNAFSKGHLTRLRICQDFRLYLSWCFKLNIFSDNVTGNVYEQLFSQKCCGCHQNSSPSQTFLVGIISSPKFWRNILCWSHVLIRAELESTTQKPRKRYRRCFYEKALKLLHKKLWKISRKMYVIEFPFNKAVRLHSTAYYRIERSTICNFLALQVFYRRFGKCLGKALSWSSF